VKLYTAGQDQAYRVGLKGVTLTQATGLDKVAASNGETITLVGYADRQTGNPAYNLALSKRRAEAVADILVKKYGISRDRLKIDWKGDTVQPYNENVWNRIVLMSAE